MQPRHSDFSFAHYVGVCVEAMRAHGNPLHVLKLDRFNMPTKTPDPIVLICRSTLPNKLPSSYFPHGTPKRPRGDAQEQAIR